MNPKRILLTTLLPLSALHAAEPPLNVLLITADDLGYEAMDFLDGKVPSVTPNLSKLAAVKESNGTSLLDHVSLSYGSNIRTIHYLDNCPTILAGGGAGIKLGHHIVAPKDTPLCNVWLTTLRGIGVNAERHGDSTGVVKELVA